MAPPQPTEDYYGVLEISQTDDITAIKSSYRRLAKIKHPDKALDKSRATADFQLLQAAYSTLIDPDLRRDYDRIHAEIEKSAPPPKRPQTPQAEPCYPHPDPTTDEAQSDSGDDDQFSETDSDDEVPYLGLLCILEECKTRKKTLENNLFEENRKVTRTRAEIRRLKGEEECEAKKRAKEESHNTRFSPFNAKNSDVMSEEKQKREQERRDRAMAIRIKGHHLASREAATRCLRTELEQLIAKIKKLEIKIRPYEAEHENEARQAEEAERLQKEAEEQRREQEARAQADREAREEMFRTAQARSRARKEAEENRKRRAKEVEAEKERIRRAEEEERIKGEDEERKAREAAEELERLRLRRAQAEAEAEALAQQRARARAEAEARKQNGAKHHGPTSKPKPCNPATQKQNSGRKSFFDTSTTMAEQEDDCDHRVFWERIGGSHVCERCNAVTRRYAFLCPKCDVLACAVCRDFLKNN